MIIKYTVSAINYGLLDENNNQFITSLLVCSTDFYAYVALFSKNVLFCLNLY